MRYDLHIHTAASDGSDSPAALAQRVREAGLELFSVTDHDTIAGALAMEALIPEGVGYIRGVEFSCISSGGKCHILGYGFDPEHPAFLAALEAGAQLRREKLERRIVHLREKFGIVLTEEELRFVLNAASGYSPWTAESLREGYLTAPGGHRIGVCGDGGEVSSLCIRVARDVLGIAAGLPTDRSLLLLGPPGTIPGSPPDCPWREIC